MWGGNQGVGVGKTGRKVLVTRKLRELENSVRNDVRIVGYEWLERDNSDFN